MAERPVSVPQFPFPPREYNQRWAADFTRAFQQFTQVMLNPGEGRNTFLVLTDLHEGDDVGLEAGTLYRVGNEVRISMLNIAAVSDASMSLTDGTVTVVIT